MAKILVIYDSRTGKTEQMAQLVAEGAQEADAEVDLKKVADTDVDELPNYDGLIVGSPTYYGVMAASLKKFFDDSVKYQGDLSGMVGGAFTSSGNLGGGNETTLLSILEAMLIHGMVIQGSASGDHYGPVSIGEPESRAAEECRALGSRVAELASKLR